MIMKSRISVLLALVSAFVTPITAQDAKTVLSVTAKALGGEKVRTVHYAGSGSSYIVSSGPAPTAGCPHSVMKSYVRDLNLERITSELQIMRVEGTPPTTRALSTMTDATSPWSSQYQFWITPYGFLKGASVYETTVGWQTLYGTTYKTVSFTVPGNHRIVGYINEKNLLEKVETSIEEIAIEAQFHGYADFGGVQFPTLITEKQGGELSLILLVNEVQVAR
jgi:hypothetical protein